LSQVKVIINIILSAEESINQQSCHDISRSNI